MPGALTFGVWAASSTRCVPGAQSPKMQRNLSGLNSTESLTRRRKVPFDAPDLMLGCSGAQLSRVGVSQHTSVKVLVLLVFFVLLSSLDLEIRIAEEKLDSSNH